MYVFYTNSTFTSVYRCKFFMFHWFLFSLLMIFLLKGVHSLMEYLQKSQQIIENGKYKKHGKLYQRYSTVQKTCKIFWHRIRIACLLTYDMEPMLLLIIFLRFKGKVKTNNSIKLNRSKVKGFIHQSVFLSITKSDGVQNRSTKIECQGVKIIQQMVSCKNISANRLLSYLE